MKKICVLALALLALFSCTDPVESSVSVKSVAVHPSSLEMIVGDVKALEVSINPAGATNKNVSWSVDQPGVATVDNNGQVTAVAPGSAKVSVKTEDGGKTAICSITVKKKVISVESVSLDKTTLDLLKGESVTLTATVLPENADNKEVIWSSDNADVVSVEDGVVCANTAGEAVITVTTADGGKTTTCSVTVTKPYKSPEFDPNDIVFSMASLSDVHIPDQTSSPVTKFSNALKQLKAKATAGDADGLDAVLISGDFIDTGYNGNYYIVEYIKSVYEGELDPKKVPMMYSIGNHDASWNSSMPAQAKEIYKMFGPDYYLADTDDEARKNYECRHCVVGGYHILCISPVGSAAPSAGYDPAAVAWLDSQLEAITKEDPEKYVIISTHPMVYNTVYGSTLNTGSLAWYTTALTDVLKKYPQAIIFGGHLHFPLNDPRSIWQGEFTSMGCASVRYMAIENGGYMDMHSATTMADREEFSEGLLIQFDSNGNMRATRMDFYRNAEIGTPWVTSYPSEDNSHLAKYNHSTLRAANTAPHLNGLDVEEVSGQIFVKFPAGSDDEFVHHYEINVWANAQVQKTFKILADFYRSPQPSQMKSKWTASLGTFSKGTYGIELTAYDSWGAKSDKLTKNITVGGAVEPAKLSVYADLDFAGSAITDKMGHTTITNNGATVGKVSVSHKGTTCSLDGVSLSGAKNVSCTFKDLTEGDMYLTACKNFSVEAFYVDKKPGTAVHGVACGTESGGWGLAVRATGVPYFITGDTSTSNSYVNVDAASAASKTDLTHVVGVYDYTNKKIKIYVNGALSKSANIPGSYKVGIGDTYNRFALGADVRSAAANLDFQCVDMVVVDVKFYQGAMTDSEVATAYSNAVNSLK